MRRLTWDSAVVFVLASVATVSVAEAQTAGKARDKAGAPSAKETRRAARDAYDAGAAAFEKGAYQEAFDNFSKANGLIASPVAAYWIARSLDALGRKAEAIDAYSKLLSGPDAGKLSPDKTETAKARLALLEKSTLKASLPPPTTVSPPTEPFQDVPPAGPIPDAEPGSFDPGSSNSTTSAPSSIAPLSDVPPPPPPPPAEESRDFSAESPVAFDPPPREPPKNFVELGIFGGPLFISGSHDLRNPDKPRLKYDVPVWQVGFRGAYFPLAYLGVAAEYAHGFGTVKGASGAGESNDAQFDSARVQLVGQFPLPYVVPFAHIGVGVMRVSSDRLGTDNDFLGQLGVGGKVLAGPWLRPYFDVRLGATQKRTGTDADPEKGIALHPEINIGLSFQLGGD